MAKSRGRSSGQRPNKTILGRTLILLVVCGVVAFLVLGIKLYQVMIRDHDFYEEKAVEQQTRSTSVSANRGTVYDTNGNVLAMSATAYTVFISPYEINYYSSDPDSKYGDDPSLIASGLSEILNLEYDDLMEKMKDTKSWYKTIATKIESDLADKVREFKSEHNIVGIHIENDSKRYYPYGSLACHVIGFVGTDNYGLEGIEALYNKNLEGTDGSVVRLTTSNGIDMLFENYENYNDAIDGSDIELTLDVNIQSIAEKYLQQAIEDNYIQNGGCCIVMNVKTGEILALANANDYDLNSPWTVSEDVQAELDLLEGEERSEALYLAQLAQWRNKALSDTYEPGSVFKILTMAMGLEEGVISEGSSFYCGGSMTGIPGRDIPLNCWKTAGHGSQDLAAAAQHSCNIAFVNIGLELGAGKFYDYVEAFGLWNKTGIDLSGETGTKNLWWTEEVFKDPLNKSQLAAASFGQTANVTPIQMITAVAATVNGGYLMEPYIVKEITSKDGEVVYSKEPTVVRQVISEETSDIVCKILESVVGDKEGTGKNAYVAGYRIGGKTGTTTKTALEVQTGEREYMVSFCGVAPADDPDIAVLVVLDNPKKDSGIYVSGGVMAAPVVGKVMSEVLPYIGVEPEYSEEEEALFDVNVIKYVGKDLEEAKTALEELGISVRVIGEGTVVTDQLPAAGAEVAAGSEVILYTDTERTAEDVEVPDLYGMTAENAKIVLQRKGLFLDTSGAAPMTSSIRVSKQSVPSGEYVPYGTVIEVTLVDNSNLGAY